MKQRPNICLSFLVVFLFFSCNKQEVCYSCDPEIDVFVKENKEQLLDFTLANITILGSEKQKAVYRSYNTIKKASLWKEKYKTILQNVDNRFTKEELKEIAVLHDFISPEIIENNEKIRPFVEEWYLRTKDEFSWNDNRYRFLLFSLESDESVYLSQRADIPVECNCNDIHSGIIIEDCPSIMPECIKVDTCEATQSGCGFFWAEACNGDCFMEGEVPDPQG